MKIIYVSNLCSQQRLNELGISNDKSLNHAIQKYHRLLVEGLEKNNVSVETISSIPISSTSCNNKVYITNHTEYVSNIKYNYLSVVNIPLIKHLNILLSSFFKTISLCRHNKNVVIICDVLNISVSLGALLAAKMLKRKSVGIVTDIPVFLNSNKENLIVKINNFLMNSFSSYVFLTDEMKNIIKCENKKYIVIEGQVDSEMVDKPNTLENKYSNKVCIYAGGLQKIYGIKYLVESFIDADIDDSELHIYGNGDFVDELKTICREYSKVKYLGVKPNNYIVEQELKATLLINPRPTNEEYTRYSFPSKNMEYMVSGTPILTTDLPGMPKEYKDYIYIIEEENVEGLSKTLKNILGKNRSELHQKGLVAKEFVLKEKNNVLQAKKIINMIGK